MDFSKYKLHKYLTEGQADMTGTGGAMSASRKASAQATNGNQVASQLQVNNKSQQANQSTQKTNIPPQSKIRYEGNDDYHQQLIKEKEVLKAIEARKSDWRTELQEKVVDGQERQQHPFVTVMPTGDENLIQAVEQMAKGVKKKKDAVTEETLDEKRGLWDNIHAKRKRGEAPAKKGDKDYPKTLNVEEVEELDEKKKDCKDGYKWDSEKKKCVKKNKKSSSKKSRTTIIMGRPLYGGGLHHHHHDGDDDNEGDGGNGGGDAGGGKGGGMGEMFDLLGDMLLKEKMEISDRMKKMQAEYDSALKKPSPFDKMNKKQKEQMAKAFKPRQGSSD